MKFLVTKNFVAGVLKGLAIVEICSIKFEVGRTYRECVGSGSYTVTACKEIA